MEKEIDKRAAELERSKEMEEQISYIRQYIRTEVLRELFEAEPAGDDASTGKKGMDPEIAAAINKELEGKTVKSKTGKEIKVTSALNPAYKEKDPRTHKKAQAIFKKTAQDFFAQGQRRKQGGKVPQSPEDLKTKKAKDTQKQDTDKSKKQEPVTPTTKDQQPDNTEKKGVTKPTTFEKDIKDMTTQQLKEENTQALDEQRRTEKAWEDAYKKAESNPDDADARKALQKAADEKFEATSIRQKSVKRTLDKYDQQKEDIKSKYPNPLSSERRTALKKIRDEKRQAFKESGYDEKTYIRDANNARLKEKYDKTFDPTNEEGETKFTVDGKNYELSGTRIDPETGDPIVIGYEVDENGDQIKDENGVPIESSMTAKDFEVEAKPTEDYESDKENDLSARDSFFDGLKSFFDFSDPIDLEQALGIEVGSSGYVAA